MSRRRQRKQQRRLPFAAYAALLFNASLCLSPFIGARLISTAFGDHKPAYEATSEALSATRKAMDVRFQKLATTGEGGPREVWAGYVKAEVEEGDMTTARGFMLAAPAMLRGPDGDSLKARLAVADGSGDQALIDAALTYLPEEVQEAYEKRSTSIVSMFDNAAPQDAVDSASPTKDPKAAAKADPKAKAGAKDPKAKTTAAKVQATEAKPEPAPAPAPAPVEVAKVETPAPTAGQTKDSEEDAKGQFNVLGDLRDLSLQAARWARDDNIDEFAFTLSGVGLTMSDAEAREGASILMSARRGKRLDGDFQSYLEHKLYAAAPPQRLKRLLSGEFQSEFGYVTSGPAVVENVFKSSVDRGALESLLADLRIIRDIARDTSPAAAVAILSQVKDGPDLRRARLVAQAGGDRAVALARYDGAHLLDTARTVITWNNALKMQMAGLAACLALLLLVAFNVLWRSFARANPKQISAIYLTSESPF